MHLREAIQEVMADKAIGKRYPLGMNGVDILNEIQAKHGSDAFWLCTVIDVADEMKALGYRPIH